MTGIERLRELVDGMVYCSVWSCTDNGYCEKHRLSIGNDGGSLGAMLADIVDQIEREHADDCFKMGERAAEDAEAAAWVRKHGGLDQVKAELGSRVPHDIYERRCRRLLDHIVECETALGRRNVRIEELGHRVGDLTRENAELKKEVFGVCRALGVELEEGDTGSQALERLHRAVAYLLFVRQSMDNIEREIKDGVNSIAECLGIRDEIQSTSIAKVCPRIIEEIDRRLMPEGYKWPTVDGRKVDFKTSYQPNLGVLEAVSIYNNGAVEVMGHDGIIKPVSEIHTAVPAADGEPLEAGQTVWHIDTGDEFYVSSFFGGMVNVSDKKGGGLQLLPSQLTHVKPEPPKRLCRDCRHWQGDPSASHMGVCFNSYRERCCVDSYAAQLDYAEACEDFEERGE